MSFKVKDHYYKKAKKEKFVARSIFKLEEIDKKYKILKPKDHVLDLGYYPGSWIQYAAKKVTSKGVVVGVDIQEVNNKIALLKNVKLYCKDINDVKNLGSIDRDKKFDVVLSDMAPKTTGIKSVDQAQSLDLVEAAFDLLPFTLVEGGNFVIKVFDSHDAQVHLKEKKTCFKEFYYLKPKSTRSSSKEFFVVAKGFIAK